METANIIKQIEEHAESFFSEQQKRIDEEMSRVEEYISTHDFDMFILRLISEHDDDYRENCYSEGCEPYPNNELQSLLNYIANTCEPILGVKNLEVDFPNDIYLFKGYYFQHIYGQGTITNIYNKDDMKLILQI